MPGPSLPTPCRKLTAVDKPSSKAVVGPPLPARQAPGPQATDHSRAQVGSLFIDQLGASGSVGAGIPPSSLTACPFLPAGPHGPARGSRLQPARVLSWATARVPCPQEQPGSSPGQTGAGSAGGGRPWEDVPKEAAGCSRRAYVWRVGEGRGQRVQKGPSAEDGGRPVIGHRWLQLDAGEGIPEERGERCECPQGPGLQTAPSRTPRGSGAAGRAWRVPPTAR